MQPHGQGIFGGFFDRLADRGMGEDSFGDSLDTHLLVQQRPGSGNALRDIMANHMHAQELAGLTLTHHFDEAFIVVHGEGFAPNVKAGTSPTETGKPLALASSAVSPTVPISGKV